MNRTDKAKMDAAKRMLRGKIDIEEVSMMLEIPVAALLPLKEEVDEEVRKVYGNTDAYDFDSGQVLFDSFQDTGEDADLQEE